MSVFDFAYAILHHNVFAIMKEKAVEHFEDRELEKFRDKLKSENDALNKLLRNLEAFNQQEVKKKKAVEASDNQNVA